MRQTRPSTRSPACPVPRRDGPGGRCFRTRPRSRRGVDPEQDRPHLRIVDRVRRARSRWCRRPSPSRPKGRNRCRRAGSGRRPGSARSPAHRDRARPRRHGHSRPSTPARRPRRPAPGLLEHVGPVTQPIDQPGGVRFIRKVRAAVDQPRHLGDRHAAAFGDTGLRAARRPTPPAIPATRDAPARVPHR